MSLPYPTDPSLPANVSPLFSDPTAVRGDHMRANNAEIWSNFAYLENVVNPIGSIIAWLPGYFLDGSNGTYMLISISLSASWKECTGAALNDSSSPIFNGAGRYLPNLTDSCFLMGNSAGNAGVIGGDNNSLAHTHAFTQPSQHTITQPTFSVNPHQHVWYISGTGGNTAVSYNNLGGWKYITWDTDGSNLVVSGSGASRLQDTYFTSLASADACAQTGAVALSAHAGGAVGAVVESRNNKNLPKYLSARYIMRVK